MASGIKPVTFLLAAQRHKQLSYRVTPCPLNSELNVHEIWILPFLYREMKIGV
jgi:hypothetical protein